MLLNFPNPARVVISVGGGLGVVAGAGLFRSGVGIGRGDGVNQVRAGMIIRGGGAAQRVGHGFHAPVRIVAVGKRSRRLPGGIAMGLGLEASVQEYSHQGRVVRMSACFRARAGGGTEYNHGHGIHTGLGAPNRAAIERYIRLAKLHRGVGAVLGPHFDGSAPNGRAVGAGGEGTRGAGDTVDPAGLDLEAPIQVGRLLGQFAQIVVGIKRLEAVFVGYVPQLCAQRSHVRIVDIIIMTGPPVSVGPHRVEGTTQQVGEGHHPLGLLAAVANLDFSEVVGAKPI